MVGPKRKRKKETEASTAKRISSEYREEVHERILRKEEPEEQPNTEAKEGWRFAADAARITVERASIEDRKHTSGGVCVAVDSPLGAVVGAEEGATESIPGNEGRYRPGFG